MFLARLLSLLILLAIVTFSAKTTAIIRDLQTTRLQSTAGVGVGSFLMDEATQLNPAAIGFFNMTALYYQRSTTRPTDPESGEAFGKSNINSFILSDATNPLKGSISYRKVEDGADNNKKLAIALASPIRKQTSMGISYRRITNFEDNIEDKYNQVSFGVTHAVSEEFSLGLTAVDPFKEKPSETRGLIGFQYIYKGFITLMGDAGADYNQSLSETEKYGAAIQTSIFDDFFLRFGTYEDRGLSESGNGIGVGWVTPKLVFDFAIKSTKIKTNEKKNITAENIKETSFALSYRF